MPNPVLVAAARSPIGRARKGSLAGVRSDDMLVQVLNALFERVPQLERSSLEDLFVGTWEQSGEQGENLARRASLQLGLDGLPGVSVNRGCASSLEAIRMAANAVAAGDGAAFVSAGVESITRYSAQIAEHNVAARNPIFGEAAERTAGRVVSGDPWHDPREDSLLPDAYMDMGQTAENVASHFGISRQDQDRWAAESQRRAQAAIADGFFVSEIVPITTPEGSVVSTDDSPRASTTLAGLADLKPVFRAHGSVTAGNSCPLNDGAAAVVVMSEEAAKQRGLEPLARILSFGTTGLAPDIMGVGPVEATRSALKKAGLSIGDVDILELNEAFAAQVVACIRQLGVDEAVVNPHGGAIALGHPFGMTGARIAATLLTGLRERDATIGVETMCVGGGQGMAMVVERIG